MSEGQGQPDFLERSWHLFCFQNVPWLHKPKEGAGADSYLEWFPFFSTPRSASRKLFPDPLEQGVVFLVRSTLSYSTGLSRLSDSK